MSVGFKTCPPKVPGFRRHPTRPHHFGAALTALAPESRSWYRAIVRVNRALFSKASKYSASEPRMIEPSATTIDYSHGARPSRQTRRTTSCPTAMRRPSRKVQTFQYLVLLRGDSGDKRDHRPPRSGTIRSHSLHTTWVLRHDNPEQLPSTARMRFRRREIRCDAAHLDDALSRQPGTTT